MKRSPSVTLLVFSVLAASSPVGLTGQVPEGAPPLRWTVDPERVRIGDGDDPEELFQDVVGVVLTRDGLLVIGDIGSHEIRFFDATTGRHLRTVGGSGQGPGEINGIWDLVGTRDELIAVDRRGLASRFDLDGAFIGQSPRARSATFARLNSAGFFDDGTELAFLSESNSEVPPVEPPFGWVYFG
jgi:hypothetical protein